MKGRPKSISIGAFVASTDWKEFAKRAIPYYFAKKANLSERDYELIGLAIASELCNEFENAGISLSERVRISEK